MDRPLVSKELSTPPPPPSRPWMKIVLRVFFRERVIPRTLYTRWKFDRRHYTGAKRDRVKNQRLICYRECATIVRQTCDIIYW